FWKWQKQNYKGFRRERRGNQTGPQSPRTLLRSVHTFSTWSVKTGMTKRIGSRLNANFKPRRIKRPPRSQCPIRSLRLGHPFFPVGFERDENLILVQASES